MKKAYRSKTIGVNSLFMLLPLWPKLDAWVMEHPKQAMAGICLANILLRFVTQDRVKLRVPKQAAQFLICMSSVGILLGCIPGASPRAALPVFSDTPPRALIQSQCQGNREVSQGVVVCEESEPSQALLTVKVPPLEGQVLYSDGKTRHTDDFNWHPKEGFWIWKKKPIPDTWVDLTPGEIQARFGDTPVALDVVALSRVGVLVTRGVVYHRYCGGDASPCSSLVVEYDCQGVHRQTAERRMGSCALLAGAPQALWIKTAVAPRYAATPGARLYVSAPKLDFSWSYALSISELKKGEFSLSLPPLPEGPTLVALRLEYWEGERKVSHDARILYVGYAPQWVGIDRPHYLKKDGELEWVKPVRGDVLEANLYQGGKLLKKRYTQDKTLTLPIPEKEQVACAYSWQRSSLDLTTVCVNAQLQEVPHPTWIQTL